MSGENIRDVISEILSAARVSSSGETQRLPVNAKDLDSLLDIDRRAFRDEGNRYGQTLIDLWSMDKDAFHLWVDGSGIPIGYCDIFGLKPDTHLLSLKDDFTELRPPDEDDIIRTENWRDDTTLDIYFDALTVLPEYQSDIRVLHFISQIAGVYLDLTAEACPKAKILKVATVAVTEPGRDFAENIGLEYVDQGRTNEGLERFLYMQDCRGGSIRDLFSGLVESIKGNVGPRTAGRLVSQVGVTITASEISTWLRALAG